MEYNQQEKTRNRWLSLTIIAVIFHLLCKEFAFQNVYLRAENKIPRARVRGYLPHGEDW